jgi:hypothetical protein
MAPKTRYFLVGSGLVVAVGLCTGLVAYYSGSLPGRTTARAEFAYLPADSDALAYADVADILSSQFSQQIRLMLPTGEDKARFEAETGIDIERDIDSVVVAMTGSAPAEGRAVVIVRGRFDAARIEALATGHGAAAESYRNVRLVAAPAREAGSPDKGAPGVAFLDTGLLALGTRDSLRAAIDAEADGRSANQDSSSWRWWPASNAEATPGSWRTRAIAGNPGLPDVVKQCSIGPLGRFWC